MTCITKYGSDLRCEVLGVAQRVSQRDHVGLGAVAGASRGFVVLVLGSLVQPVLSALSPVPPTVALVLVAVLGFVIAGWAADSASSPALTGGLAAVGSLLLALPVLLMAGARPSVPMLLSGLLTALLIGAVTAHLVHRVAHRSAGRDGRVRA